ncbi:MDR family NADP-dependent oxidoreductase [Sphingosinithalassobacter portus]|uniref:MDR family NADP-dependent oxidoreductase n=1 Tax=Stakelama portus TaxID=2676234 RepID=UPI0013796CB0|nr:NADP-dependent oxidoreductase [Sphingosinithalassobacter portus]
MIETSEITLRRAVTDLPQADDFERVTRELPDVPNAGQLLVRVLYIGLDPYVSQVIRGKHMGEETPRPGGSLPGEAVAQVIASADPAFEAGDHVVGVTGWAEQAIVEASAMRKVDPALGIAEHLGLLGLPGLTAWAGMTQLATVKPGDIVTIDGAAGSVGGTAGQIARLLGAKAVGIAGGPDKCAQAIEAYGFDDCIDYHRDGWEDRLPQDIAVHFENVGQKGIDAVLPRLRHYGEIVLCGLAQHYADGSQCLIPAGRLMGRRGTVHGLIVYDFFDRRDAFIDFARPYVISGALREVRDTAEGLDAAGSQLARVARGEAMGRAVVRV